MPILNAELQWRILIKGNGQVGPVPLAPNDGLHLQGVASASERINSKLKIHNSEFAQRQRQRISSMVKCFSGTCGINSA